MADDIGIRHWQNVADQWLSWVRKPDHDAFWAYRGVFADFVGHGTGTAIEIGCGEGRISRLLGDLGYTVTATDPVAAFLNAARRENSAAAYALASADALDFPDNSFDMVMAYNVLMDIQDVPAAIQEGTRVMRADGTFIVSIVHPFFDKAKLQGFGSDTAVVHTDPYFGRVRFDEHDLRDGMSMHFAGWSQPLSAYTDTFKRAGLAIADLAEPLPDPKTQWRGAETWSRIPLFLWLKLKKLSARTGQAS